MSFTDRYDADYFLRGKETGKSLYENYRWLPDLTIPMAVRMVAHCGIRPDHSILDFGCARGYTVRAFRELGYNAYGYDISQWALDNADEAAKPFLNWPVNDAPGEYWKDHSFDWVVAKDVLEHVEDLEDTINNILRIATVGAFVVVPLAHEYRAKYVVPEYEADVTHLHRFALHEWTRLFLRDGWAVDARYRVPGVKDNYAQYTKGNGFITVRRL